MKSIDKKCAVLLAGMMVVASSEGIVSYAAENISAIERTSEQKDENWLENGKWNFESGVDSYIIKGFTGTDAVVYPTYKGKTVKIESLNTVFDKSKLQSVKFVSEEGKKVEMSGVRNLKGVFNGFTSLTHVDLSGLDTTGVQDMSDMFSGCTKLQSVNLSGIDTSSVAWTIRMFAGASALTNVDFSGLDFSNLVYASYMFEKCTNLKSVDFGNSLNKIGYTDYMFKGCKSLQNVSGLKSSDTLKDVQYMFSECESLKTLDVSNLNTSNVTNMANFFYGCKSLKTIVGLGNLDTSNVTNMGRMFESCESLNSVDGIEEWETSKVTNFYRVFGYTKSLEKIVINWDLSKATLMNQLFEGTGATRIDLSGVKNLNSADLGKIGKNMFYNTKPGELVIIVGENNKDLLNNYDFARDKVGGGEPVFDANGGKFKGNVTKKVAYVENKIINMVVKDESDLNNASITDKYINDVRDEALQKIDAPTREGYIFDGWKLEAIPSDWTNFQKLNARYIAQWRKEESNTTNPSKPGYDTRKLIGKDRYETAAMIAKELGFNEKVILVNGENTMSDGLSAAGLAGKIGATIVPVKHNSIPASLKNIVYNAKEVYIIGQTSAISSDIENSLSSKKVVRIGGKNRYETSEKIAAYIGSYDKAFIVNGLTGEADAMSISAVAAREKAPVILTNGKTSEHMKKDGVKYTAIGGKSVVSENLLEKYSADRIGGRDRYETNAMVMNKYYPGEKSLVYYANGNTLVDALSASYLAKDNGIVLVSKDKNHNMIKDVNTVQLGGMNFNIEK